METSEKGCVPNGRGGVEEDEFRTCRRFRYGLMRIRRSLILEKIKVETQCPGTCLFLELVTDNLQMSDWRSN